ncbi:MAG TPA: SIR2 family protein [Polyangia bacterium]|jgi:hypothetical protein
MASTRQPVRFDPPHDLIASIRNGRCVAFVGAGFSAAVVPSWARLLGCLAARLEVPFEPPEAGNALLLEAVGEQLHKRAGDRWEALVKQVLDEQVALATPAQRARLELRRKHLVDIPFKAILTTNFDPCLTSTREVLGPPVYSEVLREERVRWWDAPPSPGRHTRPTPILKLHGDANGKPDTLPLVLGRSEYRRRVYGDRNYANFVRSVFAEYTVLFLGVSFTDAYLNELRSEVLHLVHFDQAPRRWG